MGAKLSIGTPEMRNKGALKKFGMGYVKIHGFMTTHSEFENGGLPIKLLISQLLLILDY